jgi:hypothetical protein
MKKKRVDSHVPLLRSLLPVLRYRAFLWTTALRGASFWEQGYFAAAIVILYFCLPVWLS